MNDLDDFRIRPSRNSPRRNGHWFRRSITDGDVVDAGPVTLFSPGGQCKSGWEAFLRWLARRFSNASGFSFDLEVTYVGGDLAYAVGLERYNAFIAGDQVRPISIRVAHVFRRDNGEGKIIHRHCDNPPVASPPPEASTR